jgi:hypothetical protein
MKQALFALTVACLLAGCGSTTPTAPPPSSAASPVARVDAAPPVVNGVQAPPSSSVLAPPASAVPQPTRTPDPELVRAAAALGFLAAVQVRDTPPYPRCIWKRWSLTCGDVKYRCPAGSLTCGHVEYRAAAQKWAKFAADLKRLQVPADTAADLRHLIRRVAKRQAISMKLSVASSWARWYRLRGADSLSSNGYDTATDRVRADLHLPARCYHLETCGFTGG